MVAPAGCDRGQGSRLIPCDSWQLAGEEGVNGAIAASPAADDIADAIVRVLDGGERLRRNTAAWATANCSHRSISASIERVREIYGGAA